MTKKLWGGRFSKGTDPLVEEFTRSIQYDYKLAKYDLLASLAHVKVLKKAGYLNVREASRLSRALLSLRSAMTGKNTMAGLPEEDVHTAIQNALEKKVGSLALRIHTARSRNDQVAIATRLYCKDSLASLAAGVGLLVKELNALGKKHDELVIPGFTHLQHAQPVYLKDFLGAYAAMFSRDVARFTRAADAIKLSMGSGALAGTPIPATFYRVSVEGFAFSPSENSLDSVSDRDFVLDSLSALAIAAVHISRLAEDLIIWATKEFGFIELDDAYCTGSSLMPQKKNPDALELSRGYAARICGHLSGVLALMKGLPLTYNRDMQLDKEPLFEAFSAVSLEIAILPGLIRSLTFDTARIQEHLGDESLYATDLVYYLIDKGMAFTNAHRTVGHLVRYSAQDGIPIRAMTQKQLDGICPLFIRREIVRLFDPVVSVRSKRSVKRS
ncbi:MAG: argininosuccinate lyase [Candidatus Omnitrophota bacterium]